MALHHIAFRVRDLRTSLDFYREVFGLPIRRDDSPRSVWLEIDHRSVLMLEARAPGEPEVPSGSNEFLALRADDADKQRIRAEAIRRGIFDGETEHTVYLRDPDGRRVGASTYPL